MKKDVKIRTSETVIGMKWYSWIEICDRCGKLIHDHSRETTEEPNMNEKDYCFQCLIEII